MRGIERVRDSKQAHNLWGSLRTHEFLQAHPGGSRTHQAFLLHADVVLGSSGAFRLAPVPGLRSSAPAADMRRRVDVVQDRPNRVRCNGIQPAAQAPKGGLQGKRAFSAPTRPVDEHTISFGNVFENSLLHAILIPSFSADQCADRRSSRG